MSVGEKFIKPHYRLQTFGITNLYQNGQNETGFLRICSWYSSHQRHQLPPTWEYLA